MGIDISETELHRFCNSRIIAELIPQSLQILAQVAFSELRSMSHTGRQREFVCAYISVFLQLDLRGCGHSSAQRSSCNNVMKAGGP